MVEMGPLVACRSLRPGTKVCIMQGQKSRASFSTLAEFSMQNLYVFLYFSINSPVLLQ